MVAAAALWALYRFTRFGVATRAATDNERAAILLGHSPQRLALINWALGSALAGCAGVLLASLVQLTPGYYTELLIPVIAAALVGGFQSFGLAAAAAIIIGCAQAVLGLYQVSWQNVTGVPGWSEALPFVIIALVLALRGRSIPERAFLLNRPLPKVPKQQPMWSLAVMAVVGIAWYALMPGSWDNPMTTSLIGAVVFLSFVVIVGYVGQISLVQMGFAGVGALPPPRSPRCPGSHSPVRSSSAQLPPCRSGLLIGLPALRVRGINLAVITLGAAFTLEQMLFNDPTLTGMDTGLTVSAPTLLRRQPELSHRCTCLRPLRPRRVPVGRPRSHADTAVAAWHAVPGHPGQ